MEPLYEERLQEIEREVECMCSDMTWSVDTIHELISIVRTLQEK